VNIKIILCFWYLLHFIGGDIMKEKTHHESFADDDAIDQNHSDAELGGSIDVSTASSATEQALVVESMAVFDKVALLAEPARSSNCYEKIRVKLHEYRTKDDKKNKKKHSESKKQKGAKKKRTREEYDDDNNDELQRYKLQLTTTPEWWF